MNETVDGPRLASICHILVAANDLAAGDNIAHLLKYDTNLHHATLRVAWPIRWRGPSGAVAVGSLAGDELVRQRVGLLESDSARGAGTELRKWFSHDPERWDEFRKRYFRELDAQPEVWRPILSIARHGTVTLVYSSHDTEHNNAVALQQYLRAKSRRPATTRRAAAASRPRPSVR